MLDMSGSEELVPAVVLVPVPEGFRHEAALQEICIFLIGWLLTGGSPREALRRLRGWVPEGEN